MLTFHSKWSILVNVAGERARPPSYKEYKGGGIMINLYVLREETEQEHWFQDYDGDSHTIENTRLDFYMLVSVNKYTVDEFQSLVDRVKYKTVGKGEYIRRYSLWEVANILVNEYNFTIIPWATI